ADVPEQIRKTFEDVKLLRKQRDEALEELAGATASAALHDSRDVQGRKVIVRLFRDRDISFAKLFAQRVARGGIPAIALVGSTVDPPGLVFAQSASGTADMGALLKQMLASVGGRGGGSRDFAQGGVPAGTDIEQLLKQAAGTIGA
ncbi:MAG TPA: DHHA1 domain-containing protein, partial [Terriglobia bacterium]|nr:DHHA1 domain-containing protein [Terriglobia bacterium]